MFPDPSVYVDGLDRGVKHEVVSMTVDHKLRLKILQSPMCFLELSTMRGSNGLWCNESGLKDSAGSLWAGLFFFGHDG